MLLLVSLLCCSRCWCRLLLVALRHTRSTYGYMAVEVFVDIDYIAGIEFILFGGRVGQKPDVQGFCSAPLSCFRLER